MNNNKKPLIIITTNEDRQLPRAFVRRCLVVNLEFPDKEGLKQIAAAHFSDSSLSEKDLNDLYDEASRLVLHTREENSFGPTDPKPGVAEFLDLIRATKNLYLENTNNKSINDIMSKVKGYCLEKGLKSFF